MHEMTTSKDRGRRRPWLRAGAVVATAASLLLAAGCGGDDDSGSANESGASQADNAE